MQCRNTAHNAVRNAGRAIENEQAALTLAEVRKLPRGYSTSHISAQAHRPGTRLRGVQAVTPTGSLAGKAVGL